jgi:hypothetical protein
MNAQPKFKEHFQRHAFESAVISQRAEFSEFTDHTLLAVYKRDKQMFLAAVEIELNNFKLYMQNTVRTAYADSAKELLHMVFEKTVAYYMEKDKMSFMKQLNAVAEHQKSDETVLDIKRTVQDVNFEIISEINAKMQETKGLHVHCQTVILNYFTMINGFLNWMFVYGSNEGIIRARAAQVWQVFLATL